LETNPLIINKYIVADHESLGELIRLLTESDNVEIKIGDIDCGCGNPKFAPIEQIFVSKEDKSYVFKYEFPDALRVLESHNISLKMTY
jgi:hypothetical protein